MAKFTARDAQYLVKQYHETLENILKNIEKEATKGGTYLNLDCLDLGTAVKLEDLGFRVDYSPQVYVAIRWNEVPDENAK